MMYCRLPFLYEMHVIFSSYIVAITWSGNMPVLESAYHRLRKKKRKLTKNCYEYIEYVAHTPSKPVPSLDISSFRMKALHEVCQVSHRKV